VPFSPHASENQIAATLEDILERFSSQQLPRPTPRFVTRAACANIIAAAERGRQARMDWKRVRAKTILLCAVARGFLGRRRADEARMLRDAVMVITVACKRWLIRRRQKRAAEKARSDIGVSPSKTTISPLAFELKQENHAEGVFMRQLAGKRLLMRRHNTMPTLPI
jgi:hypothetical protein